MNTSLRRFAPIGLYLALAAALVTGGLYIVQHEFSLYVQIGLAVIVLGLALFVLFDPQRTREAITGRQARYGSNALVMLIAFLGILIVINYVAYKNPVRWDLTQDQSHTLAPETISLLKKLPDKVTAQAFFTSRTSPDSAKTLLDNFKYNSNGKFDYTFIDPEANPIAAQQAKVTTDGTIVLQMNGRMEQVTFADEQELDTALIRLTNPGTRVVYFLTGHGEDDPSGSGNTAYSRVKSTLEAKSYTVKSLNLLVDPTIPKDALAIIIAGPRKPLSEKEVQILQDYQSKGGALVVMEEPLLVTDFGDAADPLADYLDKTWGISLDKDIIIDLAVQPPTAAVAAQYGNSTITQKLQGLVTVFPTARSLTTHSVSQDISTTDLVKTSNRSWGETNFQDLAANQVSPNQGQDLLGPVTVAVSATDTKTKARLVVIGDSDFATDTYFDQYGNGDFLINSIDWAASQDNLINLTPKNTTQRIMLPPTRTSIGLVLLVSVFILPGLVVVSGVTTWLQRRRKG